jgi:hypothetical protein
MAGPDGPSHQRTPASLVVRLVGLGTTRGFSMCADVQIPKSHLSTSAAPVRSVISSACHGATSVGVAWPTAMAYLSKLTSA